MLDQEIGGTEIAQLPHRGLHKVAPKHPKKVGKYEVVSTLGHGAMGVVYRAVDSGLGRQVAIKSMSTDLPPESEFRLRFLREARAVAQLQHPNIITIYELVEEEGTAYIVMELLEGASLYALMRKRQMDLAEKLSILQQIANGLQHAHQNGIVHRDLKPSNFFVLRNGVAKVLDFGVAKFGEGELTRAGTIFGTVEYMAPEQVRGESVDMLADVFSLGVVAYELLAGLNPFRAETLAASVFKILSDEPGSLASRAQGIPPALEELVFRAIAKKSAERFRSMAELSEALGAVARGAGIEPRPPILSDADVETAAERIPAHAPTADPVVNQWSRVAEVAGRLEEVYQRGLDSLHAQDYAGCVLHMSQVLDEVLVHSMALHYLSQSEEKLRQKRLDDSQRQEAAALLASMRTAHRQGEPQKVIETAAKLLAVDSESMEARWYRRAAETRLTTSSRARGASIVSPQRVRHRLQREQQDADLKATLIVPAMTPSSRERSIGVWVLGGAGLLFLALVGLFWGFMGGDQSKAAPVPSAAAGSPSKVRTSPFDDEEAVMLHVPTAGDTTDTLGPSLNSAIPRELPAGAETVVRVFGRDFSPVSQVVLIRGTRGIEVLSVQVLSQELLETTLRIPEDAGGREIALTVTNPEGPRSNAVQLSVVAPAAAEPLD